VGVIFFLGGWVGGVYEGADGYLRYLQRGIYMYRLL